MSEYKHFRYQVLYLETENRAFTGVEISTVADQPMPVPSVGSTVDLNDEVDGNIIKGVVTGHHTRVTTKVSGASNILHYSTDVFVEK